MFVWLWLNITQRVNVHYDREMAVIMIGRKKNKNKNNKINK